MARHVAVRGESACARRGRRPRPFRGSPRPRPGPARWGMGGSWRACVGPGGAGPRPRGAPGGGGGARGAGCGARGTPRGGAGRRRGPRSQAAAGTCLRPWSPPLDRFAGGAGGRVSRVGAHDGPLPHPSSGSRSGGGSRVGAPGRPDGVAAARAATWPGGGRAPGRGVCVVGAARYPESHGRGPSEHRALRTPNGAGLGAHHHRQPQWRRRLCPV